MELTEGQRVRLIGINAPERGKEKYDEAKISLDNLVVNKKVWLEYDRYQDDKFGRVLAWVWIDCETETPKFLPPNYMHLDGKTSRDYIEQKADGCKDGVLINQKLVDEGMAVPVNYEKRGRLKYKMGQ
jgi:endonuclease YncB( thermonuclease family)